MAAPARAAGGAVADLLSRRLLFIAGKGGSGKTTLAAALMLLAARQGKRVLGIEVDAKGDLAAALGSPPVGFEPKVLHTNISVLALHPEDSLREYMKVFFKVPKIVGLTPLSRIFDFIATSVPGPKDMLTIGKIVYEERQTRRDGSPRWDLVVVDCTATGHAFGQITAAREMRKLTRGGLIRGQLEWIDETLTDAKRSALVITALPEEMPVVEAIELYDRARAARHIAVAACCAGRVPPPGPSPRARHLIATLADPAHAGATAAHLGPGFTGVADAMELATGLRRSAEAELRHLRNAVDVPVHEVPLIVTKPGLAMSRAVAAALAEAAS